MDEQLRWFGERHRAIAPDLKGFGGTPDAPPGEATANASSSNGSASKATFSC